jgi:putative ABC transport system permease protein
LESCLIAILGGFGGLAIAWLVTLGGSPVPSMLPIFYIPADNLVLGALLAIALGIVAGAIPACRAMQLKISEALRRGG